MGTAAGKLSIATAYFLIYVVWGSTYYFIGVALEGFPTFLLGALRFSVAGAVLLALCLFSREKVFRSAIIRRSAISGIVLLFIDMAVIMLAQRFVSSSLVAIVASSTAIWIMLLDIPMWKRNFKTTSTVIGLVAGFAGVAMLYIEQLGIEKATHNHNGYGILILVAGCISWSLGTLYTKYTSPPDDNTESFAGSAWQMFFAGTAFWICTFLTGDLHRMDWEAVPASAALSLTYLVVFGSMLAYSAYIWLLKVRPATEVATHAYVNPLVAVVLGAGFGGEDVSAIQLAGLAVILFSVMLVNKKKNSYVH